MVNYFRILVIDDDEEVIKRLGDRVSIEKRKFEGRTYQIDLRTVCIRVEKVDEETSRISDATLQDLAAACSQPPHVIFADYGYILKDTVEKLRTIAQQGRVFTEQDLAGKALTPTDLAQAARAFASDETVDAYKRHNIKTNFLESTAKLYLYSYTSKDFIKALGEVSARANRTKAAFPNCTVVAKDTRYEFYNGSEFDWPNPNSKHDGKFYAHLVGGLINELIQLEFLERILSDAPRLKFVRVERSVLSVGFIVALGGAIGATAEWLGGRVVGLASSGLYTSAVTIVALAVLFILLIGLTIPFAFERAMSGLLKRSESDHEG